MTNLPVTGREPCIPPAASSEASTVGSRPLTPSHSSSMDAPRTTTGHGAAATTTPRPPRPTTMTPSRVQLETGHAARASPILNRGEVVGYTFDPAAAWDELRLSWAKLTRRPRHRSARALTMLHLRRRNA